MIQGISICYCAALDHHETLFIPRRKVLKQFDGWNREKRAYPQKGSIQCNGRLMGQLAVDSYQWRSPEQSRRDGACLTLKNV